MYYLLPVYWSRSGAPGQTCTICCRCLGGAPDLGCTICWCLCLPAIKGRICGPYLGLELEPHREVFNLLPVSWSRSGAPAQTWIICCRYPFPSSAPSARERSVVGVLVSWFRCDFLPVSWFVAGALVSTWCPELTCTICCRCLGLGVMRQNRMSLTRHGAPARRCTICCWCLGSGHQDVPFVAGVLVSKWSPRTQIHDLLPICCRCLKMYNLLPVSLSRSAPECRGAPAVRCTICCRCPRHGAPEKRCTICCRCLCLLPVSLSRSGSPGPRCTFCCRCLGAPECRFAGVFVNWCPSRKMNHLVRVSWSEVAPQQKHVRFVAGVKTYFWLPVSWSRSVSPSLGCTICWRCLGLDVVSQQKM